VRKENPSHLITVSPSLKDPDYSRINYWDNRGIISHLEIPSDSVEGELQKTAYPRGGVILSVEGGIGGTFPSSDYAGMGFYPSASAAKGVKAFVGPSESADWMRSRLESGGYKVLQRSVPEEVPKKAGEDFFALKREREAASPPPEGYVRGASVVKGYGPTHMLNTISPDQSAFGRSTRQASDLVSVNR
jgi:hypothetical protein